MLVGADPAQRLTRLAIADRGARLDLRRKGAIVGTVDTASFRVRTGTAVIAAAQPAAATAGDPAGPSLPWPMIAFALLAGGLLVRMLARRQRRTRGEPDLVVRDFSRS